MLLYELFCFVDSMELYRISSGMFHVKPRVGSKACMLYCYVDSHFLFQLDDLDIAMAVYGSE